MSEEKLDQDELRSESQKAKSGEANPAKDDIQDALETGDSTSHALSSTDTRTFADSTRAEYLQGIVLALFDQTRSLHELDEGTRELLEKATLFCDILPKISKKKPLAPARKLIRARFPDELPPQEEELLATLVAFQNGEFKRKKIDRLNLDPMQLRRALTLIALLRIANGLDASGNQLTEITQIEPTNGEVWVVVDGADAARDAAAAQHNARLWSKIGYPPMRFFETRDAQTRLLPYPEPLLVPGVRPEDLMAEAGRKVMLYHFAEMLRHEPGTRAGEDIEALHDMRVASRRMRAAFEVFGDSFEAEAIKPHLKGLRATGRALGRVRDLDVFMEKAQHYLDSFDNGDKPDLAPLFQSWQVEREQARQEMLAFLDSDTYRTFKRKFNVFLNTSGAGALPILRESPSPHLVREVAPVMIYTRLANVRAFEPFPEDASLERLHALRIEFKKLRYSVEFFREVLGESAKDVIEELKVMQDHLGDLNDANVATQMLQEFLDKLEVAQQDKPISQHASQEGIASYLASRHAELHHLIETFGQAWASFSREEFRSNLAQAIAVL